MRVSFLYYEDCPSYDLALERLREVMDEEGIPGGEVEVINLPLRARKGEHLALGRSGQIPSPTSNSPRCAGGTVVKQRIAQPEVE